jgi:AraC-like DNA-binding protein
MRPNRSTAAWAAAVAELEKKGRLLLAQADAYRELSSSLAHDAANAAYRVGYQDASHFNREYKSLFGEPPMRDVQRLREEALAAPQ